MCILLEGSNSYFFGFLFFQINNMETIGISSVNFAVLLLMAACLYVWCLYLLMSCLATLKCFLVSGLLCHG